MNLLQRIKTAGRILAGTYYGAATEVNTRRTYGWDPSAGDGNREIIAEGRILRLRSRQAIRTNEHARSIVESWTSQLIGDGIVPRSQHPSVEIAQLQNEVFEEWATTADSEGMLDFYGLQALWVSEMAAGGDVFIRLRYRFERDGYPIPLQLQTIPAEQVPDWKCDNIGEGIIRAGVEQNQRGERVAYHMYKDHPDSGLLRSGELVRVPASLIMPMYVMRRAGLVRGEPWLAPVLAALEGLGKYRDTELIRKKAAAYFLGWIVTPGDNPLDRPAATGVSDSVPGIDSPVIAPNTILKLPNDGSKMEFNTPPADGSYSEFVKTTLKAIARGAGNTYVQVSGDTKEANFSSLRADEMLFRRRAGQIQNFTIIPVLNRIWRVVMDQAVLAGRIPARVARNRADLYRVDWRPPRWEMIQPLDETKAEVMQIRAGLKARQQSVADMGYDAEEIDRLQKQDNDRADGMGLKYDSDGRNKEGGGTAAESSGQTEAPAVDGADGEQPADDRSKAA